jgi:hypothetical protein
MDRRLEREFLKSVEHQCAVALLAYRDLTTVPVGFGMAYRQLYSIQAFLGGARKHLQTALVAR